MDMLAESDLSSVSSQNPIVITVFYYVCVIHIIVSLRGRKKTRLHTRNTPHIDKISEKRRGGEG